MEKYFIKPENTIREALKRMDEQALKTLYIQRDRKLIGSISDGDIRRAILSNKSFEEVVNSVMNPNPCSFSEPYTKEELGQTFLRRKYESIPIVDDAHSFVKIITWDEFFSEDTEKFSEISFPVVIMAGGKGTRMKPFTNIFPKPMIPIGNKTMIEVIMDEFKKYSINDFYLTINYKKELLRAYFTDKEEYKITFAEETNFLGTAGSIKLLPQRLKSPFFVANCDILIKCDYADIVDFHKSQQNDLTLVASMRHLQIPYGVCEIEKGGGLLRIDEKPNYDFLVNTGLYLLNPEVVDFIPDNEFFHMTHLIDALIEKGKKVGVFPVSEKSWIDIGQWNEYRESLKLFE